MKEKKIRPQEKLDRATADNTIASITWFVYLNPVIGIEVQIQRTLVDLVVQHVGDWIDAAGAIAMFARPHIERLKCAGLDRFGQSEGFVKHPFKATWHVLMLDGTVFVADREFIPYR
jgi:hypothetical protein